MGNEVFYTPIENVKEMTEYMHHHYPGYRDKINACLDSSQFAKAVGRFDSESTMGKAMVYPDDFLRKWALRVPNEPFDEQLKMQKQLVEAQDGEESDAESDIEEPVTKRAVEMPVAQQNQGVH